MAGYGHKNALSPKELSEMHPALIGGGERAAAGLPPPPQAAAATHSKILTPNSLATANALMAGQGGASGVGNALVMGHQPVPGAVANALTGQPPPPPPPPPPPMQALPPPAAPASRPGQETSTAIGNAIALHKLSDADLKKWGDRFEYMRGTLGNLARKPDLTHADAVAAAAQAVSDKALPSAELQDTLRTFPTDPAKLRQDMADKHKMAIHMLVHVAGEQAKRGAR